MRYVGDPLGPAAPRRAAGCRWRTASRRCARARAARRAGRGSVVRLICTALRSHDPAANVDLAETAVRFRDQGLTGWDLAGPEAAYPIRCSTRRRSRRHAPAACGSRSTPASGAARRRSGARSRSTPSGSPTDRAPSTTRRCAPSCVARGVTLDLCPTSNWQAGIVPSVAEHPLARLHRVGVPVTLNTDDTTVSDITLSEEYVNAVETIGLTLPELWAIDRHALDVAFADEATLTPIRGAFAAWGAAIPDLRG